MSAPHRSFDPRRVGRLETVAWVSYYRRDWPRLLRAAVGLTRHTFGLPWPHTLYGAWLVLRANRQWAPARNDPAAARATMRRFYALLRRRSAATFDPAVAAELEVEWWRVHREHQYGAGGDHDDEGALIDALSSLYAYVYGVPPADVHRAAQQRALAMGHSDRWVAQGRDPASPLIGEVRAALVRSYAALLSAVHVP
ncbi:MAG TPA: hypothetical protein VIK04_09710 [Solirubrobacteraceae bacterium]